MKRPPYETLGTIRWPGRALKPAPTDPKDVGVARNDCPELQLSLEL